MEDGLERLRCLTDKLLKDEKLKQSEGEILQKILDFSSDGFFTYNIMTGDFYLSDKGRVKLDLEVFDEKLNSFGKILTTKSFNILKNELHEILILNKDYFRITLETLNGKIILINTLVVKRSNIRKPTELGGTLVILEEQQKEKSRT